MSKIVPHIFLGGVADAFYNDAFLKRHNITVVINMAREVSKNPSFRGKYIHVPILDNLTRTQNIAMYKALPKLVRYLDKQVKEGQNVLVNCAMGMQRSATLVAAYLMYIHGWSLDDTVRFIRSKRGIAFRPAINFKSALVQFEKDLKKR